MERLRQIQADIDGHRAKLKGLLQAAQTAKRGLTSAERVAADAIERTVDALEEKFAAELAQAERDRSGATPLAGDTPLGPDAHAARVAARQREFGPGVRGRTYADLFGAPAASPFASDEEYFKAVHLATVQGMHDPRLAMLAAMNEGVPSQGGFAVPGSLAASWLDTGLESEVVRPRAQVFPMSWDTLAVPGWDDFDHSGGTIAGFKAYWQDELSTQTTSDGKLRNVNLRAKKLLVATQISNELLADGGQSFEDQLGRKMPTAVSWALDDKFIGGTGAGQPLGILNDPALITITKESSQPGATVVLENLLKAYARLYAGGYRNAIWIVNNTVLPQLYTLVLKVKNVAGTENVGGSAVPYFTVAANGEMRLLNLPVVLTEKTPVLGTKGDVILADLSQYSIGLRKDVAVESSRHAGWTQDSTYYRAIVRVDGQGTWPKAFTPKAGDTRSWAVTIETRSERTLTRGAARSRGRPSLREAPGGPSKVAKRCRPAPLRRPKFPCVGSQTRRPRLARAKRA
jgi:HK97 family phage major capsid protein